MKKVKKEFGELIVGGEFGGVFISKKAGDITEGEIGLILENGGEELLKSGGESILEDVTEGEGVEETEEREKEKNIVAKIIKKTKHEKGGVKE